MDAGLAGYHYPTRNSSRNRLFSGGLLPRRSTQKRLSLRKFLRLRAVEVINRSGLELPNYQTALSAGMDLRASIDSEVILQPMERALIGTGIFLALPEDCEAQIRPRSGMAFKQGLTVLNAPGTVDADYRGEIKVLLINLSSEPQTVQRGDRIAQMVVSRYEQIQFKAVDQLSETMRGSGGYGHTGKQ